MNLCRTEDCTIETVGKPVFKKYTPEEHGGWFSDPVPRYFQEHDKVKIFLYSLSNLIIQE